VFFAETGQSPVVDIHINKFGGRGNRTQDHFCSEPSRLTTGPPPQGPH